jgi:hypothetical protein
LREKDGLDLGYGVQRREKWPMYRRGWYQVMGGEVGFCGPVCATFRVFCPWLLLSGCTKAVASRAGGVRRVDCFLSHMVSWDRMLPFLSERGCGPTGTFLFWLCDKDVVLSQLRRLDTSKNISRWGLPGEMVRSTIFFCAYHYSISTEHKPTSCLPPASVEQNLS